MNNNSQLIEKMVGGGSNTPPNSKYNDILDENKRVLIDWLSVSFDFVEVHWDGHKTYQLDFYSSKLRELLAFFDFHKSLAELSRSRGLNGYAESYYIGEHIRINYGGEHTKNSNGKYSINLLLSGQACREFERYMLGNWTDLLKFLLSNKASIKRLDIALDDFAANEIDIYDIEPFVKNNHFVSPSRTVEVIYRKVKSTENSYNSDSYSITFGSKGSNQLQIYDKKLEQYQKGIPTEHNIWYRYELRMYDDKAQSFAELYITSIESNNSQEFMELYQGLLFQYLDLKIVKNNSTNLRMCKTYEPWLNFLDSVKKIKLNAQTKEETTMIKKKLWYQKSYHKFEASMFSYLEPSDWQTFHYENILKGLEAFDEKTLAIVNNGRITLGFKPLTMFDILEQRKMLKEILANRDE
jgi:phage replication initiation protein